MDSQQIYLETEKRIRDHLAKYGNSIPIEVVTCWDGYIAALLEWNLITVSEHEKLSKILPTVENNPVVNIMLG